MSWVFWPFIHLFLCHRKRAPSQWDWQEKFPDREEKCHEIATSGPEEKIETGKNWPLNAYNVCGQFGALLFFATSMSRPIFCKYFKPFGSYATYFPFCNSMCYQVRQIPKGVVCIAGKHVEMSNRLEVHVAESRLRPFLPSPSKLTPSLVMTSDQTEKESVDKPDKYNCVFCKVWKVLSSVLLCKRCGM